MRKALLVTLLLLSALSLKAQQDDEYLMEIGGGVGMVSYEGDFNGNVLKNMQPMGSVVLRRILNPYMGFRLAGSFGKLKGAAADVKTYYPDEATRGSTFSTSLLPVGVTYEYPFWPSGTGRDYRGAKRLTPFIFGWGANSVFTANVPLGLGVKYKLRERLNLGVEWRMHFSLSDKLDDMADPYGIKSSGLFKNTDCYSALQLTLTYSFMSKCRTCNNDD